LICWGFSGQGWAFLTAAISKALDTGTCGNCAYSTRDGAYRVLYAFDPRRCAVLLIGGDKRGQHRWYDEHVPAAEKLYDEHLKTLRKEGRNHG